MTLPALLAEPWIRAGLGALLGLVIGSFLGALVIRWPEERSVVRGRSVCDGCGARLTARDLVPLLSAALLRYRCRRCGAAIDPVHSVMEAGGALVGAAALGLTAGPLAALGWALFGWILLALAVLDARHFWLPDALTLPLAFLGLMIGPWTNDVAVADRWIGTGVGYGVLLAIALGYRALRGREGLGLGDAKLVGAIGAWAGWRALPWLLLLASVGGLLWALAVGLRQGGLRGDMRLPLGTFLCFAAGPAMLLTL